MATRRIKSISYDEEDLIEDELGDYEDEDALLDDCFDEIDEIYGEDVPYSENEIVDALRHCDYNVDKAMHRLKKKEANARRKEQKKQENNSADDDIIDSLLSDIPESSSPPVNASSSVNSPINKTTLNNTDPESDTTENTDDTSTETTSTSSSSSSSSSSLSESEEEEEINGEQSNDSDDKDSNISTSFPSFHPNKSTGIRKGISSSFVHQGRGRGRGRGRGQGGFTPLVLGTGGGRGAEDRTPGSVVGRSRRPREGRRKTGAVGDENRYRYGHGYRRDRENDILYRGEEEKKEMETMEKKKKKKKKKKEGAALVDALLSAEHRESDTEPHTYGGRFSSGPSPLARCLLASPQKKLSSGGQRAAATMRHIAERFSLTEHLYSDFLPADVQPFRFHEPSPDTEALQRRSKGITKKKDMGAKTTEAAQQEKVIKDGKKKEKQKPKSSDKQSQSKVKKGETQLQMDAEGMGLDSSHVTQNNIDESALPSPTPKATLKSKKSKSKPRLEHPPDDQPVKENIVIIGHVDAGKSTLMGHLLVKLGAVDQRKMHKFRKISKELGKASFAFAFIMDEQQDERERGVTMDVGINHFSTGNRDVTILDAPGHQDFVPRMISGAAQADAAILVVDASPNAFESGFQSGGQTQEHVLLARSLGVTHIVVAINKLDNTTPKWSHTRYDHIRHELSRFLRQAGFRKQDINFVPCSGLTGENLLTCEESDLKEWYNGSSLVEAIDSLEPPSRSVDKALRLSITDAYKDSILGTTVAGTIDSGYVQETEKIIIMPNNEVGNVKSIIRNGKTVSRAFAGENVQLVLSNVDINMLSEGQILCEADSTIRLATTVGAELVVFRPRRPILPGAQVEVHINNVSISGSIRKLTKLIDKTTGEVTKKKPKCLKAGQTGQVEIKFSEATCVELFSEFKNFGRFTLRTGGETIAAGIITEIKK